MLPMGDNTLKYLRGRKKRKLYQQWMERANLPSDAIPREEKVAEDRISHRHSQLIPQDRVDKQKSHLNILSILLGIALVVLCAGIVLLIFHSC